MSSCPPLMKSLLLKRTIFDSAADSRSRGFRGARSLSAAVPFKIARRGKAGRVVKISRVVPDNKSAPGD